MRAGSCSVSRWPPQGRTPPTATIRGGRWAAAMTVGGAVSYLYADQLGSTVKTSGAQATTERYEPYGAKRGTDTVATTYRYTGQREESTLGLYDYGARWYDPTIGRFMQADSIVPEPGNPQSLNRYSYVLNNPMRYTDPSGNAWRDADDFLPNRGPEEYRKAHKSYFGESPTYAEWTRDYTYLRNVRSQTALTPSQGDWQAYYKMRSIIGDNLLSYNANSDLLLADYVTFPWINKAENNIGKFTSKLIPFDAFTIIEQKIPGIGGITIGHITILDPENAHRQGTLAEEWLHHLQWHSDPLFIVKYASEGFGNWPTEHPFTDPRNISGGIANSYEVQGGLVNSLATYNLFCSYIWYLQP